MNDFLTRQIWEMRKTIKTTPGTPVVALSKVERKNYQLLFMTCGCDKACTYCNYGFDYNITLDMVMPELGKIRLEDFDIHELELEANGSFLSEREIPYDLFLEVLRFVAHRGIPVITMETHYTTITEEKLQTIRSILGEEQVINFELGFESANERVRKIYNKDIDIEKYLEVTRMCEKYRIALQINVLLGAPFLTREEQVQDCINSLEFVYNEMPKDTIVVLFPINIKNNTMLKLWQERGLYDQISSWEFVELLHKIPEEYLDRFTIAWWGNRENTFTKGIMQFPKTCGKCKERLLKFYKDFYCNWNPSYRKQIIEEMWTSRCECDKH